MVTKPGGEEEAVLKHLLVGGVKQEERPNRLSCPLKVPSLVIGILQEIVMLLQKAVLMVSKQPTQFVLTVSLTSQYRGVQIFQEMEEVTEQEW